MSAKKVPHLAKRKLQQNLFRRKLLPIQIIQRWPLKKSSNDKRGIILKRKWSSSDGLIEVKWDADQWRS